MEFKFKHSPLILGQLAEKIARTPPSEDDPPFEYVDRSLVILGRTFDAHDQRMQQEFLAQREFIASQFHAVDKRLEEVEKKTGGGFAEMEKKMDGRFAEMEKKMDGRFAEVNGRFAELEKKMDGRFAEVNGRFAEMEKKMDERFQQVDCRFNKLDVEFRDLKAQFENAAAITRNGRLRRMHQPINLVKVLKLVSDANKSVWTSHPQVPKHMKDIYIMGQQAKGIFEGSWEGKTKQQKSQAKHKALHTINELAKFYDIVLWSDEASESDATEVMLQDFNVDDFMEALLAEWGMEWQRVLKLGMQHMQAPQRAGVKRPGNASGEGEKKARREEKID